jgi:hypothetical protein
VERQNENNVWKDMESYKQGKKKYRNTNQENKEEERD